MTLSTLCRYILAKPSTIVTTRAVIDSRAMSLRFVSLYLILETGDKLGQVLRLQQSFTVGSTHQGNGTIIKLGVFVPPPEIATEYHNAPPI